MENKSEITKVLVGESILSSLLLLDQNNGRISDLDLLSWSSGLQKNNYGENKIVF